MSIKKKIADLAVKSADDLGELAAKAFERGTARSAGRAFRPRTLGQIMDTLPPEARPNLSAPRSRPALPAPPRVLALPAPGPKLPSFAVKPKGGQWYIDKPIGAYRASDLGLQVGRVPDSDMWYVRDRNDGRMRAFKTEAEARGMVQDLVDQENRNQSVEKAVRTIADDSLRLVPGADGPLSQLQSWFLRAAPRYIKNEMGTPDDPMRALAERGALHVGLSPDEWSEKAGSVIKGDTIGDVLGLNELYGKPGAMPGAGYDLRANVLTSMPWLAKAPVTDKVYGVADTYGLQNELGLSHLLDEMKNAMLERSGLPSDLAVRPESLARMGLPQAAERVGLINQWRAKQEAEAAASSFNNPAVSVFKEYPDAPSGLRWVEIKSPGPDAPLPEGYLPDGSGFYNDLTGETQLGHPSLEEALKYEGDTMGHCVGGYCDDVAGGHARIFSLRDEKGQPHVTIETRPVDRSGAYIDHLHKLGVWGDWREYQAANNLYGRDTAPGTEKFLAERGLPPVNLDVQTINQIKGSGKKDRLQRLRLSTNGFADGPDDWLVPYVQDFVKSGNWSRIEDLDNAGLRYLRGELIPADEYNTVLKDAYQWMKNSPGGQAVREFYKTEMDGYGNPAYKEADKFINDTVVPVGKSQYSLNEVMNVLGDPGAWEPDIIDTILQGVDYLKENPIKLPPIFKGYARGGRALAAKPCSCDHSFSVR